MAKKSKPLTKENPIDSYKSDSAFLNYYLVLMFSVFPLYFSSQFSHIRHDKLNVFLFLTSILTIAEIAIALIFMNECRREGIVPDKKWYQRLSITDYAFGAMILLYVVSTLLSSFPGESFTGEIGRNNGLFITILYFSVYLIASRAFVYKEYVFVVFAATCTIVYVLCILNYFFIDPLGMFINYSAKTAEDFTSTIGNKNIMSAFCCATVPMFLIFFMNHKNRVLRYVYLAVTGIGFAGMLCSDSESGFLGLIPLMLIVLLFYSRNVKKIGMFFAAVSVMMICGRIVRLFSYLMGDKEKGFGALQKFFIYSEKSYILLAACALLGAVFLLLSKKKETLPRAVPFVLGGLYIVGIAGAIYLFVRYTFIDTQSQLGSLLKFFRFDEKWGTHRGYMWIKSWEIFTTTGVKNALIGWGPDTFYYAFQPYFAELNEKFGNSSTNCAHNEFLNYLITTGVLGLSAYVTAFASAIVRAFKKASENYLALAFIAPVICYLIQSVVNIATPIVTPFLFIFTGLAMGAIREKRAED